MVSFPIGIRWRLCRKADIGNARALMCRVTQGRESFLENSPAMASILTGQARTVLQGEVRV